MIQIPPRASMQFLFTNGSFPGFSPGPMTLVSNLFPEQGQFSFSQLLAGAMASPLGAKTGSLSAADSEKKEKKVWFSEDVSGNESDGGIKKNRPANLVLPPPEGLSPLFLFPPGMSPSGLLNSPRILSPLQSTYGMSHQQVLAHVTAQAALSESFKQMQPECQPSPSTDRVEVTTGRLKSVPIATLAQPTNAFPQEQESPKVESSVVSSSDKNMTTPYVGGNSKPAGDGYNWRKYGQKHVKASECHRSYYKCAYYNCPVKKKVELSLDGQVCEITYKGQHNHDPPQSRKRSKDSSPPVDRTVNSQAKPELGIVQFFPSEFARLQSSTLVANNRNVEETTVAAHLEQDEPMAKRRSMESKIVLQTKSEVDLLDDGYRWRKYGQKVVKGNPYPRSYYKCAYAGCNVRKHVERASSDPKSVITTYEGKHDHDLLTGKNSHRVAADASSQQLQAQTQKIVSRNPSPNEDGLYENKDRIPVVTYVPNENKL